jgi:hypothetical protein
VNIDIPHFVANHVVLCIGVVIFVFMVLRRGMTFGNMFSMGFFKIIFWVALIYAFYSYATGTGSPLKMLPGFTGNVVQGVAAGADATDAKYEQCLTNSIVSMQLGATSRQFCSNTKATDEWETCMAGVLCNQGGDAGCQLKTQCQFQNKVAGVPGAVGKGILRSLFCSVVPLDSCN